VEVEQVVVERAQEQPSSADACGEADWDCEQGGGEILDGHRCGESADRCAGRTQGGEFALPFGQVDGHRDVYDGGRKQCAQHQRGACEHPEDDEVALDLLLDRPRVGIRDDAGQAGGRGTHSITVGVLVEAKQVPVGSGVGDRLSNRVRRIQRGAQRFVHQPCQANLPGRSRRGDDGHVVTHAHAELVRECGAGEHTVG